MFNVYSFASTHTYNFDFLRTLNRKCLFRLLRNGIVVCSRVLSEYFRIVPTHQHPYGDIGYANVKSGPLLLKVARIRSPNFVGTRFVLSFLSFRFTDNF